MQDIGQRIGDVPFPTDICGDFCMIESQNLFFGAQKSLIPMTQKRIKLISFLEDGLVQNKFPCIMDNPGRESVICQIRISFGRYDLGAEGHR